MRKKETIGTLYNVSKVFALVKDPMRHCKPYKPGY